MKVYNKYKNAYFEALYEFKKAREEGLYKVIVVAATGIGKTYLGAFDSLKYKKVLFVAHREEILNFLVNPSGKEIQDMVKTDSEIKEAMDVLYNISSDEELRRLIDLRELAIMDEQNRLNGAKKDGKTDLLIKQLVKKFKILPNEYRKKLEDMSEETIEVIGVEIFDRGSIEELKKYF